MVKEASALVTALAPTSRSRQGAPVPADANLRFFLLCFIVSEANAMDILPAELANATVSPSFTNLETASSMDKALDVGISIL